jgi:hypothetical protein
MGKIKKFNENWLDITLNPKKAFQKTKDIFLSQFKKSYEDRTVAENIISEAYYKLKVEDPLDRRLLGAIEATLITEGYMESGKEFDYKSIEKKILFIKYEEKETYNSLIIRRAEEYLKDKGVI